MGHLTRIANMVVGNLEKGPVQAQITDLIKGNCLLQPACLTWSEGLGPDIVQLQH